MEVWRYIEVQFLLAITNKKMNLRLKNSKMSSLVSFLFINFKSIETFNKEKV